MHTSQAAQLWHLARGKQPRVLISDRELRLLAQQGKLHAEDLLWKRGFDGWRTAFSVPGLLTPPPLPETGEVSVEADLSESAGIFTTKLLIGRLSARLRTNATSWFQNLLRLINKFLGAVRCSLKVAARNFLKLAERVSAASEMMLSQAEHPRVLACLLALAVGVGTLNIVMQSSFANSVVALPKYQDRPPKQEATSASVSNLRLVWPVFPEPAGSHTLIDYAFSKFKPKDSIEAAERAEPAQSSDAPAYVPQETAELEAVPMPTRKPRRPNVSSNDLGSERVYVAPKRWSQAHRRKNGQPKPMRFGTIGFNYAAPGM